jgi:hypothetical protein
MSGRPTCALCGEPMPEGEEMFKYHGFSGPCPKPPLDRTAGRGYLADRAEAAEAFRLAIAALDERLDALPDSEHRGKAKEHLAAFAFHAGIAAGHDLLASETVQ